MSIEARGPCPSSPSSPSSPFGNLRVPRDSYASISREPSFWWGPASCRSTDENPPFQIQNEFTSLGQGVLLTVYFVEPSFPFFRLRMKTQLPPRRPAIGWTAWYFYLCPSKNTRRSTWVILGMDILGESFAKTRSPVRDVLPGGFNSDR